MRAIALLLLLAACALPPPSPPLSYPPSARQRLLAIAQAEWVEWGRQQAGATPPAAESRPENFPRVLAYWRAVPEDEGAIAQNRARYAQALAGDPAGAALWHEPAWSAAFISYVMLRAGIDTREFPGSAAHAQYIDALIQDADAFPAQAPFLPQAPADYAPRPGDLICADRSGAPLAHWRDRAKDAGRFRPLHCDIAVALETGAVAAIGGNVGDSVTMTRFATDASGRLLPRPPGAPVLFLVLENRLGRLPPWATTSRLER